MLWTILVLKPDPGRLSGIIFNVSDFFVFAGALLLVLFGKKEK